MFDPFPPLVCALLTIIAVVRVREKKEYKFLIVYFLGLSDIGLQVTLGAIAIPTAHCQQTTNPLAIITSLKNALKKTKATERTILLTEIHCCRVCNMKGSIGVENVDPNILIVL